MAKVVPQGVEKHQGRCRKTKKRRLKNVGGSLLERAKKQVMKKRPGGRLKVTREKKNEKESSPVLINAPSWKKKQQKGQK